MNSLLSKGGKITMAPEKVSITSNGLEHYSLEICVGTTSTQYGLQAFGAEAIELHREASHNMSLP